jgi:hypothetical protein
MKLTDAQQAVHPACMAAENARPGSLCLCRRYVQLHLRVGQLALFVGLSPDRLTSTACILASKVLTRVHPRPVSAV